MSVLGILEIRNVIMSASRHRVELTRVMWWYQVKSPIFDVARPVARVSRGLARSWQDPRLSNAQKTCHLPKQLELYADFQTMTVDATRMSASDTMRNQSHRVVVSLTAVSARATHAGTCTPRCKGRTRRRITPLNSGGRSGG